LIFEPDRSSKTDDGHGDGLRQLLGGDHGELDEREAEEEEREAEKLVMPPPDVSPCSP
jgi:hypothetical protein